MLSQKLEFFYIFIKSEPVSDWANLFCGISMELFRVTTALSNYEGIFA